MSNLNKLGAERIAKNMIEGSESSEREMSKMWSAGMFVGLFEAGAIDQDELDELTNGIEEGFPTMSECEPYHFDGNETI